MVKFLENLSKFSQKKVECNKQVAYDIKFLKINLECLAPDNTQLFLKIFTCFDRNILENFQKNTDAKT